jgi:hypothetical protein
MAYGTPRIPPYDQPAIGKRAVLTPSKLPSTTSCARAPAEEMSSATTSWVRKTIRRIGRPEKMPGGAPERRRDADDLNDRDVVDVVLCMVSTPFD